MPITVYLRRDGELVMRDRVGHEWPLVGPEHVLAALRDVLERVRDKGRDD